MVKCKIHFLSLSVKMIRLTKCIHRSDMTDGQEISSTERRRRNLIESQNGRILRKCLNDESNYKTYARIRT